LASKVSGLSNQVHTNKIQLQELLLGIGLFLRDLEFSCFMDPTETTLPDQLADSCMEASDAESIGEIVENFFKVIQNQLE